MQGCMLICSLLLRIRLLSGFQRGRCHNHWYAGLDDPRRDASVVLASIAVLPGMEVVKSSGFLLSLV